MAVIESVTLEIPRQPLQFSTPTNAFTQSKPKETTKKIRLECPRCCWIFEAQQPDRQHPNVAFNKPSAGKTSSGVIEEQRVCRNPKCRKQFALHWHKATKAE